MATQAGQTHHRKAAAEHNGEAELRTKRDEIIRDTIEEFRERSDDVKTLMQEYVKDKPLKALGIALITGVALGLFLKR